MQDSPSAPLSSLMSVVRVHADRVHDAALRLGRMPAGEAVERTALQLRALVARDAGARADPVGTWFALLRDTPATAPAALADVEPARALPALPEDQRLALLLRDAYALAPETLVTAVGTDAVGAADLLRRARLALLDAAGEPQRTQERARWLMARLVVVPLPDAERARLLSRLQDGASAPDGVSSTAPTVVTGAPAAVDERARRALSPLGVLLGLALAVALGLGAGLFLVRSPGGIDPALAGGALPLVTAPPPPTPAPPTAEQVQRAREPRRAETRVFTLPPRTLPPPPPPTPSPTPAPTPSATAGPVLGLDPAAGPAGQDVTVTGTGWTPGVSVTVSYLTPEGAPTGSQATAQADAQGAFRVALAADDPEGLPGPHPVSATDGAVTVGATYVVQP